MSFCVLLNSFSGAIALKDSVSSEPNIPVLVWNVNCDGSETILLNCTHNTIQNPRGQQQVAGVVCQGMYIYTMSCSDYLSYAGVH